jgi:hypothetical protein
MSAAAFKEYRLTSQEACNYDAKGVVERVVWRLMEDEPDTCDSGAMEEFFGRILRVQAAVYSAWQIANWVVVGGPGHVFDMCCAPIIYMAIEGFDFLHESHLAESLRQVCRKFPGGSVPRDCEEASAFLYSVADDDETSELLREFEKRPVEEWFDIERFLKAHRDCFVMP